MDFIQKAYQANHIESLLRDMQRLARVEASLRRRDFAPMPPEEFTRLLSDPPPAHA